ncbi:enoyl-CoA hydratase-related protein [Paracandidimonas soli]|uniref:Enoyl-CoA hydratase/carnithine racemase n=1 Tax=Paracandidimonas soli TaxID=1917182 RepID=A0A4R3UY92_9BURK|nr:enoyl-CoA hydratase-related protein [Paracandidimonas soli]TCU97285.1 enoyl-CoA hydratase/carnithine racemase [Paracandidimonas soli]
MSSEEYVPSLRLQRDARVATLTIAHPRRLNAMTFEMWESIPRFLKEVAEDPELRVLVLRGGDEKAFSSGADISQFGERRSTEEGVRLWNSTVQASVAQLAEFPKPVVALISGICYGGGFGLALHCDLRYVVGEAAFAIPAAKLGIGYYPSWLRRLTALVGPAAAKEIMFASRRYDQAQALRLGLINDVLDEAAACDMVERIGGLAPLSHRASKMAIEEAVVPGAYGTQACEDAVLECFHSEDYKEGRAAFQEKRPALFKGC